MSLFSSIGPSTSNPLVPVKEVISLSALLEAGQVTEFNNRRPQHPFTFDGLTLKRDTDLTGVNFSGITFRKAVLDGVILNKANLDNAIFQHSSLNHAQLIEAHAVKSSFTQCTMDSLVGSQANFTEAVISQTK